MFPFSNFLSSSNYVFHRPFYEREGYKIVEKDDGLLILINTLGIAKDDIKIDTQGGDGDSQIIIISGRTHDEDLDYDFELKTSFFVHKPMKKIEWDAVNGIMKIMIDFEEPIKPNVKIVRK